MSFQITEAFVKQYRNNVITLSQQKGSKFRDLIRVESGVTGQGLFFERLGATAAIERVARHADTPLVSTPHSRRYVTLVPYEWADLIDDSDKVRMLIDPQSEYVTNGVNAMGRAIDDIVIAAMWGNAMGGAAGTTVIAWPAAQIIADGATNLTLAKITTAKQMLDAADVDPDEPRYFAYTPAMMSYLLTSVAEVKSSDYNTVRALVDGTINTYMGFTWIMSTRLPLGTAGAGHRSAFAWAKSAVGLAIGADIKTSVDKRPDKSNSTQVYISMDLGAVRLEEEKIVEVEVHGV